MSEPKSVFKTYIEAAENENMLEDDITSNKAIGTFGSSLFRQQARNPYKISLLTHCNTSSLATAGYGTALGVIPALHTEGVLERAYCTETRPYYQGSRLTTFELVHEKIPATLIAYSDAATLMKDGRVDGVIVGADRVASNGALAHFAQHCLELEITPQANIHFNWWLGGCIYKLAIQKQKVKS